MDGGEPTTERRATLERESGEPTTERRATFVPGYTVEQARYSSATFT